MNSFPQFTVQSVSKYMQTKLKSGFLYQDIVSKYDVFAGKELERETGKITEDDISMLNNEGSSIIESTD